MVEWQYDPACDLNQSMVDRLRAFPREPDMLVYALRSVGALAMRGWLRLYHRFAIDGIENLPAEGSYVLVANHASHLDVVCLLSALPLRKLHRAFPAAAQDYFFVNVPRLVFATVAMNALPFDRHTRPRQSLSLCQSLLETPGNILIIFPEGTRSPTGEIGEFKPGVGLLVAGTKIPVVPCYLDGAARALPKGACVPRPRKLRLAIGTPRCYETYERGKESAVAIGRDLREAVVKVAGTLRVP